MKKLEQLVKNKTFALRNEIQNKKEEIHMLNREIALLYEFANWTEDLDLS